jgi:hypothetical protein
LFHSSAQETKKYTTLRYDTVEVENWLKASHFSKWAFLIGKWVVLNPKMGSSKIEFWRENAELPNMKVSKHSIINI